MTDYRDDLRAIIEKAYRDEGVTLYRLCKTLHIGTSVLSPVLNKKAHVSIERLQHLLRELGYRMTIQRIEQ